MRETRSKVKVREKISEVFWTSRGVRQSCSLSSGLFNVLTTDLKKHTRKGRWGGVRLKGERVYSLAYADDIVLLAEEEEEGMRAMLARLERYLKAKIDCEREKIKK